MQKTFLRHHTIWLSIASILLLSGCATPEASPPKLYSNLSATFHNADSSLTEDREWWGKFNDPILSALIEKALISNHDVGIAMSRIKAARAGADAHASRLLPTVDLQTSASTTHSGLPSPYKQGMPDVRAYSAGVGLAWELDLSGGVRAGVNAAQSDAIRAEVGADGVRLLIASEVARQYFILRGAQQRLAILKELAQTRHEYVKLISRRLKEGQSSRYDLNMAEAQANALDGQIPSLQTLVDVSQTHISLLLGANPSVSVVGDNPEYVWSKSPSIGTAQPIDLLRRRPDLMAAEAQYRAESLRSKEAESQTWPKLFVNALFGFEDFRINGMDLATVAFSNVAMAFAMPIFNAGRIQAGIDVQSAREHEALLSWQKSVFVAVKEVEDTLSLRSNEMKRGALLRAVASNHQQSLRHMQSLYREGQIDKLSLLDVERLVSLSAIEVTEHETQRLLADVQLYKALGGGWNASQLSSKEQPKVQP